MGTTIGATLSRSLGEESVERPSHRQEAKPLSANVRRHLGQSLRKHYAGALTEPASVPVSERLEALLAKLEATGL